MQHSPSAQRRMWLGTFAATAFVACVVLSWAAPTGQACPPGEGSAEPPAAAAGGRSLSLGALPDGAQRGAGDHAQRDQAPRRAASAPSPPPASAPAAWTRIVESRHPVDDGPMVLGFKEAPMDQVIRFIVESTGKTVMTRLPQVMPFKITLIGAEPLSRRECLDRVYEALANTGVAVSEDQKVVWIGLLSELVRAPRPPMFVGPDEDLGAIPCDGLVTTALIPIRSAEAAQVDAQIRALAPDFAMIVLDEEGGQLAVLSTVGAAKQLRRLARSFDRAAAAAQDAKVASAAGAEAETGEADDREAAHAPLADQAIAAMTGKELREALQRVARARQRSELDEETKRELRREFVTLLHRLKDLDR